mmetsp:Transcript_114217/g.179805  ORF Transcript_114217/g.179805 Transcript_114217/m.179805 type:complete len:206 (-) Transcript_114217:548-1165(-)
MQTIGETLEQHGRHMWPAATVPSVLRKPSAIVTNDIEPSASVLPQLQHGRAKLVMAQQQNGFSSLSSPSPLISLLGMPMPVVWHDVKSQRKCRTLHRPILQYPYFQKRRPCLCYNDRFPSTRVPSRSKVARSSCSENRRAQKENCSENCSYHLRLVRILHRTLSESLPLGQFQMLAGNGSPLAHPLTQASCFLHPRLQHMPQIPM